MMLLGLRPSPRLQPRPSPATGQRTDAVGAPCVCPLPATTQRGWGPTPTPCPFPGEDGIPSRAAIKPRTAELCVQGGGGPALRWSGVVGLPLPPPTPSTPPRGCRGPAQRRRQRLRSGSPFVMQRGPGGRGVSPTSRGHPPPATPPGPSCQPRPTTTPLHLGRWVRGVGRMWESSPGCTHGCWGGSQAPAPPFPAAPRRAGWSRPRFPLKGARTPPARAGRGPAESPEPSPGAGGVPRAAPQHPLTLPVGPPALLLHAPIRLVLPPVPPGRALHRPARHPRPAPPARVGAGVGGCSGGCQRGCQRAGWGEEGGCTYGSAGSPRGCTLTHTRPPSASQYPQSVPVLPVLHHSQCQTGSPPVPPRSGLMGRGTDGTPASWGQ